jgi:hypothetical protein
MSALTFRPRAVLELAYVAGISARAARAATPTAAAPQPNSKDSRNSGHALEPAFPAPDAALINAYEERAAILEFDAGLCRTEAERRAGIELFGGPRR